jgi:dienelactone hydrolase
MASWAKKGKFIRGMDTWGEILCGAGYIVLLVDSFRPRGQSDQCVGSISILPETPRDAFGGMNYLRSRPDVRPSSIAIMGQSYGGSAMLFAIANGALPKDVAPEKDFRAAVAVISNLYKNSRCALAATSANALIDG